LTTACEAGIARDCQVREVTVGSMAAQAATSTPARIEMPSHPAGLIFRTIFFIAGVPGHGSSVFPGAFFSPAGQTHQAARDR